MLLHNFTPKLPTHTNARRKSSQETPCTVFNPTLEERTLSLLQYFRMNSRSLLFLSCIIGIATIIFSNDILVARAFTLVPPASSSSITSGIITPAGSIKNNIQKKKNSNKGNHRTNEKRRIVLPFVSSDHLNVDPFSIPTATSYPIATTTNRPIAYRRRRYGRSARRLGRRTSVVASIPSRVETIDTQCTVLHSSVDPLAKFTLTRKTR